MTPSRKPYVGRLAPAPTGALHLGNARTFLVAWLRARKAGGKLLLRLEDLDHPKIKPGAAREAYRDLAWLGFDWDEGPADSFAPDRDHPDDANVPANRDPFVQSNRQENYRRELDVLERGGRLYPCVCTRQDLDAYLSAPNAGEDLRERRYPGVCRDRFPGFGEAAAAAGGREPAWRFRIEDGRRSFFLDGFQGPQESVLSDWSGDFVVARGTGAGYQLAVVADDFAMGVTEVVRGDDLLPSTHRQLALYEALGHKPPAFHHLPLVVGPDGRRLAKRHGDTRLSVLRRSGRGPERVLGWLARSCGWAERLREITLAEIAKTCDFSKLPRERIVAVPEDMKWLGFDAIPLALDRET